MPLRSCQCVRVCANVVRTSCHCIYMQLRRLLLQLAVPRLLRYLNSSLCYHKTCLHSLDLQYLSYVSRFTNVLGHLSTSRYRPNYAICPPKRQRAINMSIPSAEKYDCYSATIQTAVTIHPFVFLSTTSSIYTAGYLGKPGKSFLILPQF
jgi:hypothetical protein